MVNPTTNFPLSENNRNSSLVNIQTTDTQSQNQENKRPDSEIQKHVQQFLCKTDNTSSSTTGNMYMANKYDNINSIFKNQSLDCQKTLLLNHERKLTDQDKF